MGERHQAHDTWLGREVPIIILPPLPAGDAPTASPIAVKTNWEVWLKK